MTLEWSPDLEIGHRMIDNQHKQLVSLYNDLITSAKEGKSMEEQERVLNFLCEYAVKHFAAEEAVQRRIDFPDYESHKRTHDAFKVTANELYEKFKKHGPSPVLSAQIQQKVGEWLVNHIMGDDAKIGEYL